jgi:hypothetical protein
MAQQIAHWARVGRELDSSPSLSVARARQVSAAAYDQLQPEQQAVVRVLWESQIEKRAATLDLSAHFAGRDYVVAGDASGRAVKVAPPGPREAATAPKKAPARKTAAAKSKAVAKKVPARRDVATGGHVKKKAVARKTAAATSGKSSTRKAVSDAVMAGAAVNVAAGKSRVAAKRG